ncbi:unnamed protein product [Heterobilharzia americana]|nr:unnamed protein product [Heterobilharzia americana]
MIPFPTVGIENFSGFLPLPQALLNTSLLSAGGLNIQGLAGQSVGLHFAGQPSMRNLCSGITLPVINTANVIPASNIGVGVLSSYVPTGCLNPVIYYPATLGQMTQSSISPIDPGPPDSAAHTIVRAPVLYKSVIHQESSQANNGIISNSTKAKEESPPDRIVASYAAAAHAAALACHQPISRAAEAYLATTSGNRSRHSKRSRTVNHLTSTTTPSIIPSSVMEARQNFSCVSSLSSLTSIPSLATSESNSVESHKGWTRVIDRKAYNVVYISSDGVHLHNVDEVYTYLSTKNPQCLNNPCMRDLITAHFIFAPITQASSLENTVNFVHSLKASTVKNETTQDNTDQSQSKPSTSSSVNNSVVSQATITSPEKISPCRIKFNRDHSSNCELLSSKRSKLSNDSFSSNVEPKESSTLTDRLSDSLTTTAGSACSTQSCISSTNLEFFGKDDNSNVDTLHSSETDGMFKRPTDVEDHQSIVRENSGNHDSEDTQYENSSVMSTTTTVPINISDQTSQNAFQNDSDNMVAKLTTETLTTGALRTSLSSLTTEVVPSVLSPTKQVGQNGIELNLSNLTNSLLNPSQANLTTASSNVLQQHLGNPLLVEQLLAITRMGHIQHQQEQQRHANHQVTSALGGGTLTTQNNLENCPASILTHQTLSNPILSSLAAPWISSLNSSTPITSLSGLTVNPTVNNMDVTAVLQHHQQQQHLLTLAAIQQQQQQQQAQFLALIQAAALLQQQQQRSVANGMASAAAAALALRQQQQQQQLTVASVQAQNYLAALQQQFTNPHT